MLVKGGPGILLRRTVTADSINISSIDCVKHYQELYQLVKSFIFNHKSRKYLIDQIDNISLTCLES